jgi:hypothetical protein
MTIAITWWAAAATVCALLLYEAGSTWAQRRFPARLARSAHAQLREAWFVAVSQRPGSEILAVQTLRNSLMSATMTASTSALGLVASLTLTVPSLHDGMVGTWSPRLLLELVLISLLFASLISSAMAVRYYNHVSFICGIPTDAPAREQWAGAGAVYARRAGLLYSWGLRQMVLVVPILAALLHPLAGPPAALVVVAVLIGFDRVVV